jgi:hypothetical protein
MQNSLLGRVGSTSGFSVSSNVKTLEAASDLSFQNFLVVRTWENSQCSGSGIYSNITPYLQYIYLSYTCPLFLLAFINSTSGIAAKLNGINYGCMVIGTFSVATRCGDGANSIKSSSYNNTYCAGEPLEQMEEPLPDCTNGMKIQCVAHERSPAFIEKDGLTTLYVSCCLISFTFFHNSPTSVLSSFLFLFSLLQQIPLTRPVLQFRHFGAEFRAFCLGRRSRFRRLLCPRYVRRQ